MCLGWQQLQFGSAAALADFDYACQLGIDLLCASDDPRAVRGAGNDEREFQRRG
jgi:hypothetical protein